MQGIAVIWMCVGGRNRGGTRWVLAASVHGGNKRGCCLQAWVLAARVGAGCKRGCWLQAWVLTASGLCWIRERLLELHSFENTRL